MPRFKDINFEKDSAEYDSDEVVREAFVDIEGIEEKLRQPTFFIVSGPKGSGKTFLARRLGLKPNELAQREDLMAFQYGLLRHFDEFESQTVGGSGAVWESLLCLRLLPVLMQDRAFASRNSDLEAMHANLPKDLCLDCVSLRDLGHAAAEQSFWDRLGRKALGARPDMGDYTVHPADVSVWLTRKLLTAAPTGSSYFLVLDGLDYPVTKDIKHNAKVIGTLLRAAAGINKQLAESSLKAKVVVLIVDEVLDLVSDANLGKLTSNQGIAVRWYDNAAAPLQTNLLKVIGERARLAGFRQSIQDLIGEWFPASRVGERPTINYLIDHTRCVPRDLIKIFYFLQELDSKPPFDRQHIRAALSRYSDWFVTELTDAVKPLVAEEVWQQLVEVFAAMGRSEFDFTELAREFAQRNLLGSVAAETVAGYLFATGWIGQLRIDEDDVLRFDFRHRKRHAKFTKGKRCVLHPGVWKALNLRGKLATGG